MLNLLKGIGKWFTLRGNDELITFTADKLESIGVNVNVDANSQLNTLGLAALSSIGTNGGLAQQGAPNVRGQSISLLTIYNNSVEFSNAT